MQLLGKWNWWIPDWLEEALPRAGRGGARPAAAAEGRA